MKNENGREVMDFDTILRRHPQVCLVDGLAYNNPPGSRHPSRWEGVEDLFEQGISVITSINLGHVTEYRDEVARIRGKSVEETVPIGFIREVDEIVVVDAPTGDRVLAGADPLEKNHERKAKLAELREIALVLAADVVDSQLERYLKRSGVTQAWGTQERILVCLTPRANGAKMIESGRRIAFHGELIAAYVRQDSLNADSQASLDHNLDLARNAGAELVTLEGDPIGAIFGFAQRRGVTQIFVGHSLREGWWARFWGTPLDRLLRKQRGSDVRIFPQAS